MKNIKKADLEKYAFVADAQITPEDTLGILGLHDRNKILFANDKGITYDAIRSGMFFSIGLKIPESEAKIVASKIGRASCRERV